MKWGRKMSNISEEIKKLDTNPQKSKIIAESHAFRKKLLFAIRDADMETTKKLFEKISTYLSKEDPIDILGRVEGNKLRSQKNFMLSHNSMYALMAELGGLDPVLSHYMSEKYAILIERVDTSKELDAIHYQMIENYSSPKNRYALMEDMPLPEKVKLYIANNFMNELSMQTIADEFYVTKEHLMRTFKKETGSTVNELIKKSRLDEAEDLLNHSRLSVTDIAIMTGFNSVQYFSTVFREIYDMTPTDYQKQC